MYMIHFLRRKMSGILMVLRRTDQKVLVVTFVDLSWFSDFRNPVVVRMELIALTHLKKWSVMEVA